MADSTLARTFIVVDELGVDPLRNKSYEAIQNVDSFEWYMVKAEEEHNAPLIAYNMYLNQNYWWHIMVYNDISDMFELKAGMRIKKPSLSLLNAALNDTLMDVQERTVEI